jgi:hypothetical protein
VNAGAFSIQRLEGSRCGIFELCILDADEDGQSWREVECFASGSLDCEWEPAFSETECRMEGSMGTRMAMSFKAMRKS